MWMVLGNRMSIFFQGCNYNCLYCHNPETINKCVSCEKCIDFCPTKALSSVNFKVVWDKKKCIDCGMCTKVCPRNSSPKVEELSVLDLVLEIKKT